MSLGVSVEMDMNINVGTATGYGIQPLLSTLATYTTWAATTGYIYGVLLPNMAQNDPDIKDCLATILHSRGIISQTSVDIALSGTIGITTMLTKVVLADNQNLTGGYVGAAGANAGILGDLYISGINVEFLGNAATGSGSNVAPQSWVSISAH
jgi:hypothetical protein